MEPEDSKGLDGLIMEASKTPQIRLWKTLECARKGIFWTVVCCAVGAVSGAIFGPLGIWLGATSGAFIGGGIVYLIIDDYGSLVTLYKKLNDEDKRYVRQEVLKAAKIAGYVTINEFAGAKGMDFTLYCIAKVLQHVKNKKRW